MAGKKGSDWPIVYLPIGSFGDALATSLSMRLGYALRRAGNKVFVAARAIGLGEFWQIGFPHGGRTYEEKAICLAMPVFRIYDEHSTNGFFDTSVCVTRYPFRVPEPLFNDEVPISVPLFLLAKIAFNIRIAPLTSGLVLGYFQYKIDDYPWPPGGIDHPASGLFAVVPLIHSVSRIFIDVNSPKGKIILGKIGDTVVRDISEMNSNALNECVSFLEDIFNMRNAYKFVSTLGIFIYKLLPVMYLVKEEVV